MPYSRASRIPHCYPGTDVRVLSASSSYVALNFAAQNEVIPLPPLLRRIARQFCSSYVPVVFLSFIAFSARFLPVSTPPCTLPVPEWLLHVRTPGPACPLPARMLFTATASPASPTTPGRLRGVLRLRHRLLRVPLARPRGGPPAGRAPLPGTERIECGSRLRTDCRHSRTQSVLAPAPPPQPLPRRMPAGARSAPRNAPFVRQERRSCPAPFPAPLLHWARADWGCGGVRQPRTWAWTWACPCWATRSTPPRRWTMRPSTRPGSWAERAAAAAAAAAAGPSGAVRNYHVPICIYSICIGTGPCERCEPTAGTSCAAGVGRATGGGMRARGI